jgi:hypothetical protein
MPEGSGRGCGAPDNPPQPRIDPPVMVVPTVATECGRLLNDGALYG